VSTPEDWRGRLSGRADPGEPLRLVAPLDQSKEGSAGSFPARASDGRRWRVKPLNNFQSPRVCVNEYVVGRLGNAIAAAVCEMGIMEVTAAHAGWAFKQGDPRGLEPGLASASLEVESVREERVLSHRTEDENRRRHAGVYALYDWCHGSDPQWLYQANDGNRLFSHDHGHYFPSGPGWTVASLQSALDDPHPWTDSRHDLRPHGVDREEQLTGDLGSAKVRRERAQDAQLRLSERLRQRRDVLCEPTRTTAAGSAEPRRRRTDRRVSEHVANDRRELGLDDADDRAEERPA
jgi:hypothetical protein